MNSNETLQEELDQLGREIGSSPEFVRRVNTRLKNKSLAKSTGRTVYWRNFRNTRAGLAVAATIAICLCGWWLSRPANVYARMLEALAKADTVHTTGWTRRLVRRWPLEDPANKDDDQDTVSVKHDVEAWHWSEPDGTPRSYERQGPVIEVRRGGDSREYQEDVDLMFIFSGGHSKDKVDDFKQLGEYLRLLQRPSLVKRELGTRHENGRELLGLRHIEGNRIDDIWIDVESGLPQSLLRVNKSSGERTTEIFFTVNEIVPEAIISYEPPSTQNVRYGGNGKNTNLAWRQYVQQMGVRLQDNPIDGPVALLFRDKGKTFANQWTLPTPDGKYHVKPLDLDQYQQMDIRSFIRLGVATKDGERSNGTWRVPKEFHKFVLPRSDLVYVDGTPWQEWLAVALSHFDLEFVDQEENRTVWVAKQDGRSLKRWQDVDPPVPYIVQGGVEKKGHVEPGIGHKLRPVTLKALFADFNRLIDDKDLTANKPRIVDETGLPQPPKYNESEHGSYREYHKNVIEPEFLVATDSPWFVGKESLQMAKDWYRKEFGITFEEVEEPVTVHVIRRK